MSLAFLKLTRWINWEGRQERRRAPTALYHCLPQFVTPERRWLLHPRTRWWSCKRRRCDATTVCVTQAWMQGCVRHWGASRVGHVQFGRNLLFGKVMLVSRRAHQGGFCLVRSAFTSAGRKFNEWCRGATEGLTCRNRHKRQHCITLLYSRDN